MSVSGSRRGGVKLERQSIWKTAGRRLRHSGELPRHKSDEGSDKVVVCDLTCASRSAGGAGRRQAAAPAPLYNTIGRVMHHSPPQKHRHLFLLLLGFLFSSERRKKTSAGWHRYSINNERKLLLFLFPRYNHSTIYIGRLYRWRHRR